MNLILFDQEERWQYLNELAEKCTHALVSSYNIYTGATKNGDVIVSTKTKPARLLMNTLSGKNSRIVLSVPPFYPCKESCEECSLRHRELIDRFKAHSTQWPNIKFKYRNDSHLKLYLFYIDKKWQGVTGGMNLSLSSWKDCLIPIPEEDITTAVDVFRDIWSSSSESVDEFLFWSF